MQIEFLLLNEASKFLRIKPSTLYAWTHAKKIPHRKHGGKLIFVKSDLVAWSNDQQTLEEMDRHGITAPIGRRSRSLKTKESHKAFAPRKGVEKHD